jgi:hypothetical protein
VKYIELPRPRWEREPIPVLTLMVLAVLVAVEVG